VIFDSDGFSMALLITLIALRGFKQETDLDLICIVFSLKLIVLSIVMFTWDFSILLLNASLDSRRLVSFNLGSFLKKNLS
jgi:hypothetical protein